MPFLIRSTAKFSTPKYSMPKYSVYNAKSGHISSYGTTRENAIRQMQLLNAMYEYKKNKKSFWF